MSDYKFHPDLHAMLPLLPILTDFSTTEKVRKIRKLNAEMMPVVEDRTDVTTEDRMIPGPKGAPEVRVRIYRPGAEAPGLSAGNGDNPLPGILEIHGGGFMLGSIEMTDRWCQFITATVGVVVVSVEYRLAPEHPFPAGIEDCYAALCWMATNADSLGVDATRIAISGQSAGGGLAAGTALMARDRGGPALALQLLEIPELDDRLDTPSMLAFEDTPLWNRPNAVWSWKHYLGPDHAPGALVSPYAAPARAEDLRGLPTTYISTMQYDPLRDEGLRYGMRLMEAGVTVEMHSYAGTFHGSAMVTEAEPSVRNLAEVVTILGQVLGGA